MNIKDVDKAKHVRIGGHLVNSSGTIAPKVTATAKAKVTGRIEWGGVPRRFKGYSGYWIRCSTSNNGVGVLYTIDAKAEIESITTTAQVSYSYSDGENGEAAGLITKDTLSVSVSDFTDEEKKKLTVLGK